MDGYENDEKARLVDLADVVQGRGNDADDELLGGGNKCRRYLMSTIRLMRN